ncbi:MAG: hypothetical protein JWQ71_1230 [Pedosphaera sp.]|nr:hypothetical protein [Pedosphaera sp.]
MKSGTKTVICLLGSFALAAGVRAVVNEEAADNNTDGNPFKVIVERNVFDLRPPPPPASATASNTPPPNVKLTGIATILGKKQALFMVQEAATPGKGPNKELSYILTEGQREGAVEVVEINEKANTVRIKNDGNISLLTFETPKLPTAAAMPTSLGLGAPNAGGARPNYVTPQTTGTIPAPTGYGQAAGVNNGTATANGLTQIPLRTVRTDTTTQTQDAGLSREANMVLMEAERERTKDLTSAGLVPPLPPTPLTQGGTGGGSAPSVPTPPQPKSLPRQVSPPTLAPPPIPGR